MSKYWFKPKLYGWGFVPTSWQGWLMTTVFIGILLLSVYANGFFLKQGPDPMQTANFIFDLCVGMSVFSLIALKKTEGEVRWNWGKRN